MAAIRCAINNNIILFREAIKPLYYAKENLGKDKIFFDFNMLYQTLQMNLRE